MQIENGTLQLFGKMYHSKASRSQQIDSAELTTCMTVHQPLVVREKINFKKHDQTCCSKAVSSFSTGYFGQRLFTYAVWCALLFPCFYTSRLLSRWGISATGSYPQMTAGFLFCVTTLGTFLSHLISATVSF